MNINYQAALAAFVICAFVSTQQSSAQDQVNSAEVLSGVVSAGIPVTLTYDNEPPSQEAIDGLQKIRETKANRVHTTPQTPIVENLAIAPASGMETQAPSTEEASSASLAPGDYQKFEEKVISSPAAGFRSTVAEISIASNSNIIFATGNWWAAISFDHGDSWRNVDPFSQFPASDGGFCCDQEVIYDESRDMMIWILQYLEDGDDNRYRVAVSVGHDNLARGIWTYYDFLPANVGLSTNRWFDYPHIALGDNRLFLAYNSFRTADGTGGATTGWMAMNLDNLADGVGVQFNYWDQSTLFNFTPVQGATSTYYWASHLNNTTLRVYRWSEGGSILWDDVTHDAYQSTSRGSANCPDSNGNDPCVFLDDRVQVGWVGNGQLGFGWMVAQGGSFANPYTRFLRMNESDRSVIDQPVVFSSSTAWVFPSLGVNDRGHLGGSIAYVTNNGAPNIGSWIADDFNSVQLQPLQVNFIESGTDGPQCERWGDYYRSRPHSPYGNTWVATGHTLNGGDGAACGNGSSQVVPRMFWFGRERDLPQDDIQISSLFASLDGAFIDGSGSTSTTNLTAHIPLNQPYCTSPWNYCGGESIASVPSDMVDWGLVRIYAGHPSSPPMTLIAESVGLIKSNGFVTSPTNTSSHSFSNIWGGNYWIAFYHRNHLGVLTDEVKNFEFGASGHSFRFDGSWGVNSQRFLSSDGLSTMWGGDASKNGTVSANDFTSFWLPQNGGPPGYLSGDFDMNGTVSAFDFINVWLAANGRTSAAPAP